VTDVPPFAPSLVKAVFRDVTPMHVSRSAAWAAASVTRTVLTQIIDGARRAAAEQARKKLIPADLLSAIDRNVELEVGTTWYTHSPTFHGLTGVLHDAEGVIVPLRQRRGSRKPSAVAGAHRFRAGVRKLLRSRGATAVPAMVRDLDGIASVFLTDLARDAAMVVREGGVRRFGTVTLAMPGEPAPSPFLTDSHRALPTRRGDGRTIGRDDVLAATRVQLFGGDLRQRALTEAGEATPSTSAG
jgi:histone H3/H4